MHPTDDTLCALQISLQDARRIALAGQGFDRPRPRRATADHVGDVIRRLGVLQLDYFNVLVPSHYLVLFSRLGKYRQPLLEEVVHQRREFTEQWAHERSIVPMEHWPLFRYRRETDRVRPWGFDKVLAKHPEYLDWVLGQVRERGPLGVSDIPEPPGATRRIEASWYTIPRATLEAHFVRGTFAIAGQGPGFTRLYDLAERVVPAAHHQTSVERLDAQRKLLEQAARAHGIAAAADLADYYRMPIREARPRLAELVAEGKLREVRVDGWREPAFLHPEAHTPRRINAASLLSPFDPVVWYRKRAARLFGFDYRVEIFIPPAQRRWGVYVLPFLLGDRLVARVDLKSDREQRRLLVQSAYLESHAQPGPVAAALATELRTLAAWLELDAVAVARRGNLARALAAVL